MKRPFIKKRKQVYEKIALEVTALRRDLALKTEAMEKLKTENEELARELSVLSAQKNEIADALITAHVLAGEIEREARANAYSGDSGSGFLSEQEMVDFENLINWL